MTFFSPRSKAVIAALHPDLQRWLVALIKHVDFSVTEGPRSQADQDHYFATGLSKVRGDQAKHCRVPCEAVHLLPYPWTGSLNGQDARDRLHLFAGYALAVAREIGVNVRWGGDWNGNMETRDNSFDDLMHFELR